MEIKRDSYLEQLKIRKDNGMIKIITGIRRCGKSFLLFVLFHKIMGNADSYLDPKRIPARRQWSEDSHKRKYENDWVVDILPGNDEYDLGYDYHECGICKLCQDEGCPELAVYLCRMDYVLADIMNMKLVRTGTIAEGASCCDFRYSKPR